MFVSFSCVTFDSLQHNFQYLASQAAHTRTESWASSALQHVGSLHTTALWLQWDNWETELWHKSALYNWTLRLHQWEQSSPPASQEPHAAAESTNPKGIIQMLLIPKHTENNEGWQKYCTLLQRSNYTWPWMFTETTRAPLTNHCFYY